MRRDAPGDGPDQHDLVVSFTSHLAQLASTALAATVAENLESPDDLQVPGRARRYDAPG